jgi:hypothetical protein
VRFFWELMIGVYFDLILCISIALAEVFFHSIKLLPQRFFTDCLFPRVVPGAIVIEPFQGFYWSVWVYQTVLLTL